MRLLTQLSAALVVVTLAVPTAGQEPVIEPAAPADRSELDVVHLQQRVVPIGAALDFAPASLVPRRIERDALLLARHPASVPILSAGRNPD